MTPLESVILRPATVEDAPFVALVMRMALGESRESVLANASTLDLTTQLCQRTDTLYSYAHTWVACCGGQPVGACIAYPGIDYAALRAVTFPWVKTVLGVDLTDMAFETQAGEYYIDSLAVLPEYQGQGVATALLQRILSLSPLPVALFVTPNNKAQKLYRSLGFVVSGEQMLFGERYYRMEYRPL